MSHLAGSDTVASLVVFEDALPRKSDYRRFNIAGAADDTAAVAEVVTRRFRRYLEGTARGHRYALDAADQQDAAEPPDPVAARNMATSFSHPPSLLLIDGDRRRWRRRGGALDDRHRRHRRRRVGEAIEEVGCPMTRTR